MMGFRVLRCIVVVLLTLLGSASLQAETESISATPSTTLAVSRWKNQNGVSYSSTLSAAKDTFYAYYGCNQPWPGNTPVESSPGKVGANYVFVNNSVSASCLKNSTNYSFSVVYAAYCPSGTLSANSFSNPYTCIGVSTYVCPDGQGWALNGTQCVREKCTAVQTRYEGVCRESCPKAGSGGIGTGKNYQGDGSAPSALCIDGCQYKKAWTVSVGGGGWGAQSGVSTGASCSTTKLGQDGQGAVLPPSAVESPPAATATDAVSNCTAKGEGYGTVNGVTVCSGTDNVTTERVDTSVDQKTPGPADAPTGPTETTTTEKRTTCVAGVCTTETVKKVDPGTGESAIESTEKGTVSGTAYCEKNPNDTKCVAAKTTEQGKYCKDHPDSVSCKDMGTPTDGADVIGTKAAGVSAVSPVSLPVNMSCPADIQLPVGAVFEWAPICDAASMLRPLVLAFAWLSAGLIAVGGLKSGG